MNLSLEIDRDERLGTLLGICKDFVEPDYSWISAKNRELAKLQGKKKYSLVRRTKLVQTRGGEMLRVSYRNDPIEPREHHPNQILVCVGKGIFSCIPPLKDGRPNSANSPYVYFFQGVFWVAGRSGSGPATAKCGRNHLVYLHRIPVADFHYNPFPELKVEVPGLGEITLKRKQKSVRQQLALAYEI